MKQEKMQGCFRYAKVQGKKGCALLLALILTMTMLMGCGQNSDGETGIQSDRNAGQINAGSDSETDLENDGTDDTEANGENDSQEAAVYGFHVDGTRLLDANGNEFIMRGVNHAHAWFADHDMAALNAIAETGANSVRLVLSDGEIFNRDSVDMVSALISRCKTLNMIAILEVHDGTGDNDPALVEAATEFWIDVKDALIGNEAYAIINIINEWQGSYNRQSYEETYYHAVKRLREAGIQNTILIDASGWGQDPRSIVECGQNILAADPLGNTMFAIHMYGTAGRDADTIKNHIDSVRALDLCVCIGEFGWNHSDGDVDEDYIMQYCTETGVGYLAWSWKGNGGGVEYLDMTSDWNGQNLSEEWGEKVVNGEYGIRNTSVPCTVFTEE